MLESERGMEAHGEVYLTATDRERLRHRRRFVKAWFSHSESFWSWNGLSALCRNDPDEAWRLIVQLVDGSPSDAELGTIGLNPLTELLIAHGARVIDRIETEAARSRRFRLCLAPVYQNEDAADIAEDVWARIEKIQKGLA
jgi:hypothetical protein